VKVYFAGFEVFAPDAENCFAFIRREAIARGLEPLTPSDNRPPSKLRGYALASWIKRENMRLIQEADAVVGNISPFRGPNMDPGTAWEIGFAEALNKPVALWSEDKRFLEQRTDGCAGLDLQGWSIEQFGLPENLMIAVNVHGVFGSITEALDKLKQLPATADERRPAALV
jgi:nucleoside 2-deoxyribosyltransferase